MYFRQLLNDDTACASYLLGCKSRQRFAVVDPHMELVDEYIGQAEREGMPIVAVFETHVQADHVSGLPELVERTGATGSGAEEMRNGLTTGYAKAGSELSGRRDHGAVTPCRR
jgi:glyoxylase-like metal-dependent hydrolase (beta-lactamase superfamily II)